MNKKHTSIKLDYKALENCIVFLDARIYLQNGKLHKKIYRKETDRQHYLQIKLTAQNHRKIVYLTVETSESGE